MFLGFLPQWVGDLSSVLGLPAITIAVIVWALGRRDANRKLVVDEGTLKVSEFDSFTKAQDLVITAARSDATIAQDKADQANDRLDVMDTLYDQMRDSIIWLRAFVQKVVSSSSYKMNEEERKDFEMTKPPPRPPRRKM